MPTIIEIELAIRQNEGAGPKRAFVFLDELDIVEFTFVTTIEGVEFAQDHDFMTSAVSLVPGDDPPENGGSYEPTELPNDKYGRTVSGITDLITDSYTAQDDSTITVSIPTGTPIEEVYSRLEAMKPLIPDIGTAKSDKLIAFKDAVQQYVNQRYSLEDRLMFQTIYKLADEDGLTNRSSYLRQGMTWGKSIIAYGITFQSIVMSQGSAEDVVSLLWDIESNTDTDPHITLGGALLIPD